MGLMVDPDPLMNAQTAATYTDKPTREAFRRWAARKGVQPANIGRPLLYRKSEIDRGLGLRLVEEARRRMRRAS